ncbi:uncharacterized protein LOC123896579 [Trifolium pratense]|uniref:uncharacterized protein LOC123896579 n=1 Tax=Trifolium pratense TaxID=57577 RepID=UPI001E6948CE|nr:uncharacterized protein LOC123896579 [Trifolium pratense]
MIYVGFNVSGFLENDAKEWNVCRVLSMFDHATASRILATPLYPMDDRRIWRGESNGDYSVKSSYHICVNELIDISHLHVNGSCNLIWALQIQPKVKNLIWRICRRCVPTRVRLRDKGVDYLQTCALCNNDEDDNMVFTCASTIHLRILSYVRVLKALRYSCSTSKRFLVGQSADMFG